MAFPLSNPVKSQHNVFSLLPRKKNVFYFNKNEVIIIFFESLSKVIQEQSIFVLLSYYHTTYKWNNILGLASGREPSFFWLSRSRTENFRDPILPSRSRPEYRIYRKTGIPKFIGRDRSVMGFPKVGLSLQNSHFSSSIFKEPTTTSIHFPSISALLLHHSLVSFNFLTKIQLLSTLASI